MLNPVQATRPRLLPRDWRRDPVAAGTLLATATAQLAAQSPPTEQKADFWPGVPPLGPGGMLQRFTPGSPATWIPPANGYGGSGDGNAGNSAVFACLTAIAGAFPEPPLRVRRWLADGESQALPRHALQPLLLRPNPHHTDFELWFWTQFSKHTHGNAFWRKVRAGDALTGNVIEVWPLSAARVEPVTTAADRRRGVFISSYRYEVETGRYEDIPPENIVHFRLGLDDCDHRLGCSPLKRLLREVATDDETTRFVGALLANFAVPGLIVTTPDRTLSEEDAERIKTNVSTRFSGDLRGAVGVLNNGATAAQFGFSPEQLDMKTLHRVPEERIAAVLRVPAVLAGLGAGLDRSIYNNAREAREAFTEQTLTGLWRADAARINLELLPDFDSSPDVFTEFDLTDVRALQEDEDKKYARLNLGVQGQRPWIKRNEARAAVGFAAVPGWDEEDEAPAPAPPQLLPGGQDEEEEAPPQLPPPGEERALTALQQKAQALEAFPLLLEALQELARPGLERDLEAFFDSQRDALVQAVVREGALG